MFLALDDTDGRDGGCTTYLMTKIIGSLGLDVIGFPRLVRLNPNIPYKTRGNASLAVRLGTGTGERIKIGEFQGKPVFSYKIGKEVENPDVVLEEAWKIVASEARIQDSRTNPGLIATDKQPGEEHYFQTLREVVSLGDVKQYLQASGMKFVYAKNGRGLIGALAAISWVPSARTFELIAYRYPKSIPYDQQIKMEAARFAETVPGSFNNLDPKKNHAAIFPSPNTPVQYGIRASEYDGLVEVPDKMENHFRISHDAYMIFESNQSTDEQYIWAPDRLEELRSYSLVAEVSSDPNHIIGGHWFFDVLYHGTSYGVAVFEPTKSMRKLVPELRTGDILRIWASFKTGTLNLEKAAVLSRSRVFERVNPNCVRCGKRMNNHGLHDYRCGSCGNRSFLPAYVELKRREEADTFETPVSSRRHLVATVSKEVECPQ